MRSPGAADPVGSSEHVNDRTVPAAERRHGLGGSSARPRGRRAGGFSDEGSPRLDNCSHSEQGKPRAPHPPSVLKCCNPCALKMGSPSIPQITLSFP